MTDPELVINFTGENDKGSVCSGVFHQVIRIIPSARICPTTATRSQ